MSSPPHLSNQALLLDFAPELPQCLLELVLIFNDYLQAVITPLIDILG
jgi:hypothetical protein